MTSFFVVPSFAPVSLEQLPAEPDDVTLICRQEALITQELQEIREYNKEAEPLGVIAVQEEVESEPEELTDEDLTEEDEEEEEEEQLTEEEGASDIDEGDAGDGII